MNEPLAQPKTIVLNVNDSDAMRFAISAMLKRADFEVLEAATGEEALSLIEAHEPHVVVLDVHLPGANGFEICRRVRKNPCRGTTRILHTSAMSVSLEDKIESLESGADGFLEQPFELDALLSCVRSLLDIGQTAVAFDSLRPSAPPGDAGVPRGEADVPRARADHVMQTLDQIGEGVICLDGSWRFTFVNAMAERVLGRKRDELLGQVMWAALPELERSAFATGCRRAMDERAALTFDGPSPAFNAFMQARGLPSSDGLLVLLQDASAANYPSRTLRAGPGEDTTFVGRRAKTLRGL